MPEFVIQRHPDWRVQSEPYPSTGGPVHSDAGAASGSRHHLPHLVNERQSCVAPTRAIFELGAGFQQLVWRVRYQVLVRKRVALTGSPVARRLTFAPTIRRDSTESKAFVAILNCILANIEHAGVLAPPFVLAELEEALIVSMLFNFAHSMSELLDQERLDAGSWQVKRVEEYTEGHLEAPFDIERIAEVTGISTPSIYRAFKRSRGYSTWHSPASGACSEPGKCSRKPKPIRP